jgi:hypothetical protein
VREKEEEGGRKRKEEEGRGRKSQEKAVCAFPAVYGGRRKPYLQCNVVYSGFVCVSDSNAPTLGVLY